MPSVAGFGSDNSRPLNAENSVNEREPINISDKLRRAAAWEAMQHQPTQRPLDRWRSGDGAHRLDLDREIGIADAGIDGNALRDAKLHQSPIHSSLAMTAMGTHPTLRAGLHREHRKMGWQVTWCNLPHVVLAGMVEAMTASCFRRSGRACSHR